MAFPRVSGMRGIEFGTPGFILSIIGWFADNPKRDWKTSQVGRWVYRLSGILIFLAAIQIVRGADLAGWIIG